MNNLAILKALNVTGLPSDESISGYLPDPLATEVIDLIREINIMRRFVNVFTQRSRTWTKPKRISGQAAYFIPDGVTATESSITATQVVWTAKKLMTHIIVDMEAIEDSQPDVVEQILEDSADAMAEAEELIMLQGDPTHLATAPTPSAATETNWFNRDARLAHEGIFTVAGSVDAATTVDASSASLDVDFINEALFNLGKFGRVKSRIAGFAPSDQAANIRQNSSFKAANVSGQDLASFITGLGSAGEGSSLITVIYGVPIYEAPQAPEGKIAMYRRDVPHLGDRRRIKFANEPIIESDQRRYVVSERISLNYHYRDAMVLIDNLSTTV